MKNKIFQKIKKELPKIRINVPLKNHTTFKIGGPAKFFYVAKTKEDLIKAILVAKKLNLPFYFLGGGSKLLVSDKGFEGLIIKIKNSELKIKDSKIIIGAGVILRRLTKIASENGLSGMEWATGIPGAMVGGAVRGNAGAFDGSMKKIVKKVETFDIKKEKIINLKSKDCKFDYRTSIFKQKSNLVVLSCQIQLKKKKKEIVVKKMRECLSYRQKSHPLNFPSGGSIFENFPLSKKLFKNFQELVQFEKLGKIPAGFLIAQCGLVGKKFGNVKISEKHANFIVNLGNGKAKDVKKLIEFIKKKVRDKFGVDLREEIQYLNYKNI